MRKFFVTVLMGILLGVAWNWQLAGVTSLKHDWRQYFAPVTDYNVMRKMAIASTGDIFVLQKIGFFEYFLWKFDRSGNLLKEIFLSNSLFVEYDDMVLDKEDNLYLIRMEYKNNNKMFLERYDNDCALLGVWILMESDAIYLSPGSLYLGNNGEFFVVGYCSDENGFLAKFCRQAFAGEGKGYSSLASYAAAVKPIWIIYFGSGSCYLSSFGLFVDKAGNIFLGSSSFRSWGNPIIPFQGAIDVFLAELDSDGNLIWNSFLGGWDDDIFMGLAGDARGNIVVVGESSNAWGNPVRPWSGPGGCLHTNTFVALCDSQGQLLWNTFLGNGLEGNSNAFFLWRNTQEVIRDESSNIYLTGVSGSGWGQPLWGYPPGRNLFDGYIAKLDQNGSLLWHAFLPPKQLGGIKFAEAIPIVLHNGSIYIAGMCGIVFRNDLNNICSYCYLDKITESSSSNKLTIEHQRPEK